MLRPKQERFCREYLVDLNATQAAVRSGYSARTARAIGSENLAKPDIQTRLAELRIELAAATGITPDRVLKELGRIAFADARRVMTWGPGGVKLIDSSTLTEDDAAIVAELSESVTKEGGSIRLKMWDKLAALDRIAKHLGMFNEKQPVAVDSGQATWEEFLIRVRKAQGNGETN